MSFASLEFIVFFAIVLLSQCVLRSAKARRITLLGASYVFYGWWDWRFCFLMLALTLIAYFTALSPKEKKLPFILGVVAPLTVLGIFKYLNFFVESFCALFGIASSGALRILLPVGISFYTFQSLSYTIDVRRGKLTPSRDFVKFALYISFFPQLVAGPIVKAADFLPQLEEDRKPSLANLQAGISLFVWGLFKKTVLADRLGVFADAVFATPAAYSAPSVWLAVFSYAFQIWFDFAGYSDMAIGAAKCLGYDLPRNFDLPYLSANVTEFWRRWHISLSTWLREYLYIPLGGNRKGRVRTYVNLMLTMLLGGLWHGAGWNFVLWGGLHGAALCVHKLWMRKHIAKAKGVKRVVFAALTFLFVSLVWVPFRAGNFQTALTVYGRLFASGGIKAFYTWSFATPVLACIAEAWCAKFNRDEKGDIHGTLPTFPLNRLWGLAALFTLIAFTLVLMYTGETPFIYFQF